jgi:hypothetical protein
MLPVVHIYRLRARIDYLGSTRFLLHVIAKLVAELACSDEVPLTVQ